MSSGRPDFTTSGVPVASTVGGPSVNDPDQEATEASGDDSAIVIEPPMKRRRGPLIAVIAIVLFLGLGLWLAYRPVQRELQGTVDAREIRITSKVTGRIARFHVEEGQSVSTGALLYTVDSPEVDARRQQAGGALTAAEARADTVAEGARPEDIRAAEAQWRRAQAAAQLAQTTAERTQRLFVEGVVPGQRRDEARANAVSATQAERAARAQYDLALAGARRQDRQAAGGQVEQARGALAEVDAAARETRVTAPVDGEVGRRLAQPGELVPQGFPVFTLTEVASPWVTINVREDEFGGLRQGTVLTGRIPALNDHMTTFRVTYLAPAGDFATWRATRQSSGFDVRSFEVRAVPTAPVEGLRPGMTVLFAWPQ